MKPSEEEQYHELAFYTLSLKDPSFIHQHIVDAFAAQTADELTRPITLIFALAGLYASLELGYTGRQVQLLHMKMAKHKRSWPVFEMPAFRGRIRISHVLAEDPGAARDKMIFDWCASAWEAFSSCHDTIIEVLKTEYL